MFSRTSVLVGVAAIALVVACTEQPTEPESNSAVAVAQWADAKMAEVEICHRRGTGTYQPLTVNGNAEQSHRKHGDGKIGEVVPSMNGFVFAGGCAVRRVGQIAFTSERDGNWEIYVMNADGTGERRLTSSAGDDMLPVWSPDGSRIAFTSTRDGNGEVYVMNADGSDQTNLTNHPGADGGPRWSPDGTRIAFTTDRDGVIPGTLRDLRHERGRLGPDSPNP